ncbi:MAG TPA: hypothetical protein VIO37_05150 [Candidatus Dormibacteraeota bacterium]
MIKVLGVPAVTSRARKALGFGLGDDGGVGDGDGGGVVGGGVHKAAVEGTVQ